VARAPSTSTSAAPGVIATAHDIPLTPLGPPTEQPRNGEPFHTFTINPFARDPNHRKVSQQPAAVDSQGEWKQILRRKKRSDKCVTGNMESDSIQSSGVRPLKLFITRCDVSATAEKLQDELLDRNKWNILETEQLKTRFENYKSFKMVINRGNLSIKDFLRPECWPKGLMIREFRPPRRYSPSQGQGFGGRSA